MNARRDPDRLIRAFLSEGEETLHDQVYDAVRTEIEQKPQRAGIGPWRTPIMIKIVGFGLAAAAVVAAVLIGAQLLGSPGGGLGADPAATATPQPTPEPTPVPTPSPPAEAAVPAGPFVVTGTDDPVQITVNIASSRWVHLREFDALIGDDDGLDPPETVGAWLGAWGYPAGTGFNVYGDPCRWSTTIPETPATTVDEIAADLAAVASRDATAPMDVTVGEYDGKTITLQVPNDAPDREAAFADCDQNTFASWGVEGDTEPHRWHQGPGQIDELWILDVDGAIVILDATYGPAAPADLVEELRTLAESATFEAP